MTRLDNTTDAPSNFSSNSLTDIPVEQQLRQLLDRGDATAVEGFIAAQSAAELARAVDRLDDADRRQLVELIDAETAADLLEQLPSVQAIQILEDAEPAQAAAAVDELPSDLQADLLSELEEKDAEAILSRMQPDEARGARQLQSYPDDVAGGLMVTELLQYPSGWTVNQVVNDLQANADAYRDYQVQYAYVCGDSGELLGVLRLRDLLLGDRSRAILDIMIPNPLSVSAMLTLEELHGFFQQHHFLGVPVTDVAGRLVGVVQRADVDRAWIERQDRSFLQRQGIVSGEELRSLPLLERASGRLTWLSLNIVLNLFAVAVISRFESTLAAVIALTAFLPMISDMSGCSGNQAVAVSIRELMLGIIRPSDMFRVWLGEISLGILNGTVVGLLLALIAWIWKGSIILGVVVGLALALNTMVAVSLGGLIPLVLRRFGRDPAVASGPLLTTVTDMCGFFLVLSMASVFIEQLKGI